MGPPTRRPLAGGLHERRRSTTASNQAVFDASQVRIRMPAIGPSRHTPTCCAPSAPKRPAKSRGIIALANGGFAQRRSLPYPLASVTIWPQQFTILRPKIMLEKMKFCNLILASVFLFLEPTANALAISLEVARKCNALTTKAFPPRVPGNPAAGRKNGTGREVRAYFNRCVANSGHAHRYHSRS